MWIHSRDIRDQFESCQKSRKILDDFLAILNFFGAGLPKIVPSLSLLHRGTLTEIKFREDTPNSPEVIEPNTLNCRPNFKFSRLKFYFGEDPLPVPVCASKAWSICSACKNFRAQHPLRAEI